MDPEPAVRIRWEPEEVVPGLYRIPLPYAYGSSVNVLAASGAEGVLLVDAGFPSEEARSLFDSQMRSLGISRADVRLILLTHADIDHVAFARDLQQETGARVLLHPRERDRGSMWRSSEGWLRANGYDGPALDARVEPPPLPDRLEPAEDGAEVAWAGFRFRLIHCPGHTPGLVCAHDPGQGLLLSTDHVLRSAPTPIGLFGPEGDPLAEYVASLERLRGLEPRLVVPGHGRPFTGLGARLDEIAAGIDRQLARLRAALGVEPASAWEITDRAHPEADPRRRVMLLFFVLAGLRRLERAGDAVALEAAGAISYRAA